MKLKLTNTLTRKKEVFTPQKGNNVKMYVCGITPYDYSHVGHGRVYVVFDVLVRLLRLLGYNVTYVRNITDIDDKLLKRAAEELSDEKKFTQIATKYTQLYHEDMQKLGCLKPDFEPKATEHIAQMIAFIKELIERGHAYVIESDVYFDVQSFKNYGKLSGRKLDDLQAGARVEVDERKKHPADFVLWKGNKEGEFWKADWGHGITSYGRPGWHLECSVMAREYLGDTIDIHGGGMDLVFPHHENEVAQSECLTGKPFVRFWLHNAFVNVNKEKMSKSLGNFFTLRVVMQEVDPMVLRFFFLQHYYKTPLEFNLADLKASETAYKKLALIFEGASGAVLDLEIIKKHDVLQKMLEALCDDMNTPKMFGVLFEHLHQTKEDAVLKAAVQSFLHHVLGLTFHVIEDTVEITPEMQDLIDQREEARASKDWALADKLRDQLKELGYKVRDKKL